MSVTYFPVSCVSCIACIFVFCKYTLTNPYVFGSFNVMADIYDIFGCDESANQIIKAGLSAMFWKCILIVYLLTSSLCLRNDSPSCCWQGVPLINHTLGAVTLYDIPPKLILSSNLAKYRSSVTFFKVGKSFWNFALSTTVTLPCSVQNSKTNRQLKIKP